MIATHAVIYCAASLTTHYEKHDMTITCPHCSNGQSLLSSSGFRWDFGSTCKSCKKIFYVDFVSVDILFRIGIPLFGIPIFLVAYFGAPGPEALKLDQVAFFVLTLAAIVCFASAFLSIQSFPTKSKRPPRQVWVVCARAVSAGAAVVLISVPVATSLLWVPALLILIAYGLYFL